MKKFILALAYIFCFEGLAFKSVEAASSFLAQMRVFEDPGLSENIIFYSPADKLLHISPLNVRLGEIVRLIEKAKLGTEVDFGDKGLFWAGYDRPNDNPNLPDNKRWPVGVFMLFHAESQLPLYTEDMRMEGRGLLISMSSPSPGSSWTVLPPQVLKEVSDKAVTEVLKILLARRLILRSIATDLAKSYHEWLENSEAYPEARPSFRIHLNSDSSESVIWRVGQGLAGMSFEEVTAKFRGHYLFAFSKLPTQGYIFDQSDIVPEELDSLGLARIFKIPDSIDADNLAALVRSLIKNHSSPGIQELQISPEMIKIIRNSSDGSIKSFVSIAIERGEFIATQIELSPRPSTIQGVYEFVQMSDRLLLSVPKEKISQMESGSIRTQLSELWNGGNFWVELEDVSLGSLRYLIVPREMPLSQLLALTAGLALSLKISLQGFPLPSRAHSAKAFNFTELIYWATQDKSLKMSSVFERGTRMSCSDAIKRTAIQ